MKRVAILGVTGSLGAQALEIVNKYPDRFKAAFLADSKADQALLKDEKTYRGIDVVLNCISGIAGLAPSLAALSAGAALATANKESIIAGWGLLSRASLKSGAPIIPVDSEHSAVFQCLEAKENVNKIILTASGGAFRDYSAEELKRAKAREALNHPTWKMGKKITIDCATLVNKGMEVLEAKRLFGIEAVEVVLHRQSIVHGLVETRDGSVIACMGSPSMKTPLQYALTYPERLDAPAPRLDFKSLTLEFAEVDRKRFPCLRVAEGIKSDREAAVFAGADEALVELYLRDEIAFTDFAPKLTKALEKFAGDGEFKDADEVLRIHGEAREYILKNHRVKDKG